MMKSSEKLRKKQSIRTIRKRHYCGEADNEQGILKINESSKVKYQRLSNDIKKFFLTKESALQMIKTVMK